jgi:hypothetical protein
MAWVRQANTVIPFENIDVSNSNGSLSVVNLSTVRFLQAGIYQIDLTFQILPTSTGKINLELESRNITISSIVGTPARVGYFNVQSNEIFTISSFSVITFSANDELQFSLNTVNTLIVDGATGNINNVSIKITRIT